MKPHFFGKKNTLKWMNKFSEHNVIFGVIFFTLQHFCRSCGLKEFVLNHNEWMLVAISAPRCRTNFLRKKIVKAIFTVSLLNVAVACVLQ